MTHNKAFTTNLSLDSIPNNIQEALAILKLKEVVSKEMKGDLGSGRLALCQKKNQWDVNRFSLSNKKQMAT